MKRALWVIALTACGEVKDAPTDGSIDDAPPTDAPPDTQEAACDLNKPFDAAVQIPNLHNAAFNDTHAALSANEKVIFFASDREGLNKFHIYTATRTSIDAAFGAPTLVGSLSSSDEESHPTVTADGNTVIFDSFRPATGSGVVHIFTATRSNIAVDFGTPTQILGDFMISPTLTAVA